jgi:hypothetical protein
MARFSWPVFLADFPGRFSLPDFFLGVVADIVVSLYARLRQGEGGQGRVARPVRARCFAKNFGKPAAPPG